MSEGQRDEMAAYLYFSPMLSYWEKQSLLSYDIIIVGSGIVGLSTAISIKERAPEKRVLVMERSVLPTGASTKNAGFACIGSLTEIIDDLNHMTEKEVLGLVELRLKGLKKLRTRLGDKNIGYAENGSWELISKAPTELSALEQIDNINDKLKGIVGGKAFDSIPYKGKEAEFGFSNAYVQYLVSNNYEGELNTGRMMRCLIDKAISVGVEIKTGTSVSRIEEQPPGVDIVVEHPELHVSMVFKAAQVCICTNAFTRQFYPEIDIQPGRGQVLITKPIDNLPFKGIYHFDKGYFYFRELQGRVLFGGGRNLDFEGETTAEFAFNEKIRADLTEKLKTIILPNTPFEIEDWWTGIMAFGATKSPIVLRHSNRICLGVRMGGMGVAIGSEVGEKLAELVLE